MHKKKPVVAIMYDFDKTLSTTDMQEYSFIPSLGMEPSAFWQMSDELAKKHNMDHILATMMLMIKKAEEKGEVLTRQKLAEHGKTVVFHKGVDSWFERINAFGERLGLDIRHYIISCGLKPMIEASAIGDKFSNIFACDYVYDQDGRPIWPSIAINYSSKIQYMYRINKGVEEVYEHNALNIYTPDEERPISFSNMIYVGDGLTDVPIMKIVRQQGGSAIGVYQHKEDGRYLIRDGRVDFYVKADYREGSEMEHVMKAVLYKIRTTNHFEYLSDMSYHKGSLGAKQDKEDIEDKQ